MSASDLIQLINKMANSHFANSNFSYHHKKPGFYVSNGDPNSKALNHYKNSSSEVNAIRWFEKAWIYSTIEFIKSDQDKIQSFTLSVFWGEENDFEKKQLFRAEWDFYEGNTEHPQPHWHFYTNKEIDYLKNTFAELVKEEENRSFLEELSEERSLDSFPIEKFHFAMNAMWATQSGHIHDYSDMEEFIYWLDGLLDHIRSQLSYVFR
jgi:hypothetical protein